MHNLWRRVRGVVGTAVTWGAAWFAVGATWFGIKLWGLAPLSMLLSLAGGIGIAGMITGAGFALVLGVAGRRLTLGELGYLRIASWGALGGMLVWTPLLLAAGGTPSLFILSLVGALGAVSSAGTLALARMGASPHELRDGDEQPAIAGG